MEWILEATAYGRVAMRQFGDVPENFRLYQSALQGTHPDYQGYQVTGAEFRTAKSGPRKGQLCIPVPGTDRSTYVSVAACKAEQECIDSERAR